MRRCDRRGEPSHWSKGREHARGHEWLRMASIYELLMHDITPNHQIIDSHEMIDRNGVKRGDEGDRGHLGRGWWGLSLIVRRVDEEIDFVSLEVS
jgi:hypothetical protein